MLYVPAQIVMPKLKATIAKPFFDKYGEYIFRFCSVLFTFLLSISVPCLELLISLIGALACGSLAYIFPPLLELVCQWRPNNIDNKFRAMTIMKSVFLLIFGIFASVIGSLVAIKSIVMALQSPTGCI